MTVDPGSRPYRRASYIATVVVNLVLAWVANNLVAWGWFDWLTEDFDQALPAINASFAATIVANVVYMFYDRKLFKKLVDLIPTFLSLRAALVLWRVYPFDFSAYSFNWDAVTRVLLALVVLGTGIGLVVSAITAFREIVRINDARSPDDPRA